MIKEFVRFFKRLPAVIHSLTLSNWCTVGRMVLVPFLVGAIINQHWMIAEGLLLLAAVSDVLDGYLARVRGEITTLGTYLDPIADKFLLFAVIIAIAHTTVPFFPLPWWFVCFVLVREFLIILGAGFIMIYFPQISMKPTLWGKLTMGTYIGFLLLLITSYLFAWELACLYSVALAVVVGCSVFSFLHYAKIAIVSMRIR